MSKARLRVRRDFRAQAAKIRQDRAAAIGELRSMPELSKRLLDQGTREVEAAAEHEMEKLRMSYGDALGAELSRLVQKLWGLDETERTSGQHRIAWRDAVRRALDVSNQDDALVMFRAAAMADDTMMLKALGFVGQTRSNWGPMIHKLWYEMDERAAALMDEHDELEEEMSDSAARIEDMAELSLRGVPSLDHGEPQAAPQLSD